jgi:hypothetical protein
LVRAKVLEVDTSTGYSNFRVIDQFGNYYDNVRMITPAGNAQLQSNFPVRADQEIMLLKTSTSAQPYALGGVDKPILGDENQIQIEGTVVGNADSTRRAQLDYFIDNEGNRIALHNDDGVTVSSVQNLRLQYNETCRLSHQGSSGNNPIQAQPFFDEIYGYLQDVERRQDAIVDFIEFLGPPLVELLNTVALLNAEPPDLNNPGEFLGPLGTFAKVIDQKVEEATEPLAKTHDVSKTDAEANTKSTTITIP